MFVCGCQTGPRGRSAPRVWWRIAYAGSVRRRPVDALTNEIRAGLGHRRTRIRLRRNDEPTEASTSTRTFGIGIHAQDLRVSAATLRRSRPSRPARLTSSVYSIGYTLIRGRRPPRCGARVRRDAREFFQLSTPCYEFSPSCVAWDAVFRPFGAAFRDRATPDYCASGAFMQDFAPFQAIYVQKKAAPHRPFHPSSRAAGASRRRFGRPGFGRPGTCLRQLHASFKNRSQFPCATSSMSASL